MKGYEVRTTSKFKPVIKKILINKYYQNLGISRVFSILETVGYVINHKDNQLDNVTKNLILSMGIKIDGDKLGIGTDLFSDKKTLIEEKGLKEVQEQLGNNSNFFNDQFISEKRNSVFDNKLVTERKEDK